MLAASGSSPRDLALHRRAVEAVIWGNARGQLPVDARGIRPRRRTGRATRSSTGRGLLDWTNQTLTPNPDVIYVMPFFTTKDVGPNRPRGPSGQRRHLERQHHELLAGGNRRCWTRRHR